MLLALERPQRPQDLGETRWRDLPWRANLPNALDFLRRVQYLRQRVGAAARDFKNLHIWDPFLPHAQHQSLFDFTHVFETFNHGTFGKWVGSRPYLVLLKPRANKKLLPAMYVG